MNELKTCLYLPNCVVTLVTVTRSQKCDMMTGPQLRGVLAWSGGRKSPVRFRDKAQVGGLVGVLIKFKQNFSKPVI